jgi:hypothetical protein
MLHGRGDCFECQNESRALLLSHFSANALEVFEDQKSLQTAVSKSLAHPHANLKQETTELIPFDSRARP